MARLRDDPSPHPARSKSSRRRRRPPPHSPTASTHRRDTRRLIRKCGRTHCPRPRRPAPRADIRDTVTPTSPRPAPHRARNKGLMAAAGSQVRMVDLVTVPPTATPSSTPTESPRPHRRSLPRRRHGPRPTPAPTATPTIDLDAYALVGRIAFTQWNVHTDRPDVYIWDTKLRQTGAPLPNYRQPDFGPNGRLVANGEGSGQDNLVEMGWLGEDAGDHQRPPRRRPPALVTGRQAGRLRLGAHGRPPISHLSARRPHPCAMTVRP